MFGGLDPATLVDLDAHRLEPGRRARLEAKGDDHGVSGDDLLGARHHLGTATTVLVGLAQAGTHHLDAFDPLFTHHRHRLTVEQEVHALLAGVGHLTPGARHVLFVTAVRAGHLTGALTDGGAVAVHGGIATAQHHHTLTFQRDKVLGILLEAQAVVDVGDQVVERLVHPGQVLAGEATFHIGIGAHAEEHGVVLRQQFLEGDVLAHLDVEAELHAHLLEHRTTTFHHRLLELELGDAEGQQAADLGVLVEDHRLDAVAHQDVGAAEASGSRADDRDLPVGPGHLAHVRAPAHGEGGVGDVLLHRTDGHRAEAVIEGAVTLAQTVLGAYPATHFGQRVGAMRHLRRFEDVALADQLQPVGNVVVDRALPLAVGVTAVQAAMRLAGRLHGLERLVDLGELAGAGARRLLLRILTTDVDELKVVVQTVCHDVLLPCSGRRRVIRADAWTGPRGHSGSPPWASPARSGG